MSAKRFDHRYAVPGHIAVPGMGCAGCAFFSAKGCTCPGNDTRCSGRPDGHNAIMLRSDTAYQHDILIPVRLTLYSKHEKMSKIPPSEILTALTKAIEKISRDWTDHVEHAETHQL